MSHFPSGLTLRSRWTLYFIQDCANRPGFVWYSQRRSLKVCVILSRWMIWHLEGTRARRKVSAFQIVWACACLCAMELVRFSCLHSAVAFRTSSVHFLSFFFFFKHFSWPWPPVELPHSVTPRSPSEMRLFDLTGTGLLTESRDYAVSVEHKQAEE